MLGSEPRSRAINLRNFAAHKKQVLCTKIGRKSGQIVATGGEDALVKVWHVANDEPLMTLTGHKSAVTCVAFNGSEDVLVAGSESGSVRLWDLNSEQQSAVSKVYQGGHRSSITCIDFHPFASYFATGSLDTNLKVWDSRAVKECVQTYKGGQFEEKETVSSVKFTPDGKWIVSGGDDGTVKIYDLMAGKMFKKLQTHRSSVTCIDFHPSEFLVATGSADRTVQILGLDGGMELISKSDIFPSGIKSVQFSPNDGSSLLSFCNEGLKVHSWNESNMRCIDNVDAKWGNISDVNLHQGLQQIFAVSANNTIGGYIGVWVVPIESIRPWNTGDFDEKSFSPQLTSEMVNENLNSSTEDVLNEIRNRKPVSVSTTTTNRGEVITVTKVSERRTPTLGGQSPQLVSQNSQSDIISAKRKEPANLDIDNFLPKGETIEMEDDEIIENIMKSHTKMASAMSNRFNNMKLVRRIWLDQADPKEAIRVIVKMKDIPLASDLLNQLLRPEAKRHLSLDLCVLLLPLITDMMRENYEEHLSTAMKATLLLYSSFSGIIEESLNVMINPNSQVDINLEARAGKCQSCKKLFGEIKRLIIERSAEFAQVSSELAVLSRRTAKSIR